MLGQFTIRTCTSMGLQFLHLTVLRLYYFQITESMNITIISSIIRNRLKILTSQIQGFYHPKSAEVFSGRVLMQAYCWNSLFRLGGWGSTFTLQNMSCSLIQYFSCPTFQMKTSHCNTCVIMCLNIICIIQGYSLLNNYAGHYICVH